MLVVDAGGASSGPEDGGGSMRGSAGGRGMFGVLRGTSSGWEDEGTEDPRRAQRLPMRSSTTFTVSTRMERSNQSENRLM